jgi:two-component system, OmpR family, sensor histidine kinase BaeS
MRLKISTRLQLAILLVAALTVLLVTFASRWNLERAFIGYLDQLAAERFVQVLPRLRQAYERYGGWQDLVDSRRLWFRVVRGACLTDEELQSSFDTTLDTTGALSRLERLANAAPRLHAGDVAALLG